MKLEGKVAFRHSNIGLEPESQSFVFNEDDQISTGYRLQNKKVKEYEDALPAFLESNEQGLDSSQRDMESADCKTTPGLDFSNSMVGMQNEYEALVRDLVEPASDSTKDVESLMKVPNDIESVKRSPTTSPISNPAEERVLSKNSMDVYMDKTVTECEPHLEVCYKESSYHVVKDICVDEGALTKDKVMFVNTVNEKANNFFPSEFDENKEKQKDNTSINVLSLSPTDESDKVSSNLDQPKELMHKDEDKISGHVNKEKSLPEDKVLLQDLLAADSVSSDDKGKQQISDEPELHSQLEESKNTVEEEILEAPSLALADGESKTDSITQGNETFTHQLDPSALTDCGKEECHRVGSCKCDEPQHTSKPIEGKSDDEIVTSHVRHSLGESSFSAIGPMSGRISYSGPVPYSGSISLRSDSSTTSTRSFAFPILQSEWGSSPVRMAKGDRRHYRKQRCWKDVLCCKF